MIAALDQKLARYRELEQQLYDPAVATDPVKAGAIAKERGALAKIVEPYLELLRLDAGIKDAEAMVAGDDADLRAMAEEELGPSLAQMDPATKDENVLSFLIDMKIVAKAADDEKIADSEDFKKRLAFTRSRLLMDSLLFHSVGINETSDSRLSMTFAVQSVDENRSTNGGDHPILYGERDRNP